MPEQPNTITLKAATARKTMAEFLPVQKKHHFGSRLVAKKARSYLRTPCFFFIFLREYVVEAAHRTQWTRKRRGHRTTAKIGPSSQSSQTALVRPRSDTNNERRNSRAPPKFIPQCTRRTRIYSFRGLRGGRGGVNRRWQQRRRAS